jgi:succinate dehydrogenase / fumarate reductase, cytochrome b subunit
MSWVVAMFTSSIGRKYVMSITGLFLCSFLVVHLVINLLLFVPDGGLLYNTASDYMEHNILIRTIEILLFAGFIIHIIQSITLTRQNAAARQKSYEQSAKSTSTWASRNMGILGSIIFVFLVIHLRDFFWDLRFNPSELTVDQNQHEDLYKLTVATFEMWPYSLIYFLAMFGLGYHLWHGFQSAFRSIGIMNSKYTPAIVLIGKIYTLIVTIGFMAMPVWFYFAQFIRR